MNAVADLVSNLRGRIAELIDRAERAEADDAKLREVLQGILADLAPIHFCDTVDRHNCSICKAVLRIDAALNGRREE